MANTMHGTMSPFLVEVLETHGGSQVLQCYQCGTCSGSCPVIDEMEYGPRRIMHLIQAGEEATVLSSKDMWRCVSCYSCASRCPRGIEITDLMADLRRLALEKGYAQDKEAEFGLAFAETVQVHGRMFEPELLTRYYLRVLDFVSLLGMVPLGLKMLVKGKLPFVPERVANPDEIKEIGVVGSTRLQVATGVSLRHDKATQRVVGGVIGGLIMALLAGLLMGLGLGKGRAR
jgi:heterodisulfide reductase subunit C